MFTVTALSLGVLTACSGSVTDPSTVSITVAPITTRAVPDTVYGAPGVHFSVDITISNSGPGSIYRVIECGPSLERLQGGVWVRVMTGRVCTLELRPPQEIPAGTAIPLHEDVYAPDAVSNGRTLLTSAMVPGQYRARYDLLDAHKSALPESAEISAPFTVTR